MARKYHTLIVALAALVFISASKSAPPEPPPELEQRTPAPERDAKKDRERGSKEGDRPMRSKDGKGDKSGKNKKDGKGEKSEGDRDDRRRGREMARPGGPGGDGRRGDDRTDGGVPKEFRERFEKLPPEAKRRFLANWSQWREMEPRERREAMQRAFSERKRVDNVIDEALTKLGLDLTPDEREVFELRYRQERRKVEEGLRDEVAAMRKTRVDAMMETLRAEFGGRAEVVAEPDASPGAR